MSNTILKLQIISEKAVNYNGKEVMIIDEGILFSPGGWFYPILNGIPRLCIESFLDYAVFLEKHLPDYKIRKQRLLNSHRILINATIKKNKRTKESFDAEWNLYDIDKDKTWDAGGDELVERFLKETDETITGIKNKIIFDAGCGNGKLNCLLAEKGIVNYAMDFSNSIEKAYRYNTSENVHFIQGDIQHPPFAKGEFDIVHCSGVLIHTENTEFSFTCLTPFVRAGGKLSVWLYHHRKDFIHNMINNMRKITSKLPLKVQYWFYRFTLFPVSYIVKRIKGNRQNKREMMIDILDWFSPQFRWEHTHTEAASWFIKENFSDVKITTLSIFGFNITGKKLAP